jgi:hypothetical protein
MSTQIFRLIEPGMSEYQSKLAVSVAGGSNPLLNQDLISSYFSSPRPVINYWNWQKVLLCIVLEYDLQLSQGPPGNSSQRSVSLTGGVSLAGGTLYLGRTWNWSKLGSDDDIGFSRIGPLAEQPEPCLTAEYFHKHILAQE